MDYDWLLEMLEQRSDLTLELLNLATQAWAEVEYNRSVHRELAVSPLTRFRHSPSVLRDSPSSQALRNAFRCDVRRRQRHHTLQLALARYYEHRLALCVENESAPQGGELVGDLEELVVLLGELSQALAESCAGGHLHILFG